MALTKKLTKTDTFAVGAALQFETAENGILEVTIFIDWATSNQEMWIAQYKCGNKKKCHVLDDTDELQFTDECMARQMVKVIKDTYSCSEFQVKREIECVRRIYYGGNKMLMWQNFPERLKVIFENV